VHTTDSVIHCAASLNRKSEKSCLNVNLRGTLEVLTLARSAEHYHGLRRFSQVSTVAVAGKRQDEVVTEDRSIDWERSDYDPYARTKKFCEHMMRVCYRKREDDFPAEHRAGGQPLCGDDAIRHGEGVCVLAGLPVLAVSSDGQDRHCERGFCGGGDCDTASEGASGARYVSSFVGSGVADVSRNHESAGRGAEQEGAVFVPVVERPFAESVNFLANRKERLEKVRR